MPKKKKKQKNRRRSRPAPSSNSPPRKRRLPAPQMPAEERRPVPLRPPPTPIDNPYANKIVRLIEDMASMSGISEGVILKDWCGMLESGLQMWPDNMRAMAIEGHFIEDPPHIQQIFAQARERYLRASEQHPAVYRRMQESFSEAFAILLDSAAPGLDTYGRQTELNPDVIGQVFVTCLQPGPGSRWWDYFPGWLNSLAAARQAIPDGDELVYLELAQAALKARSDGHAVELEPGRNWPEWFQTIQPYVEPILIGPPLVNSSVMMLAAATRFADWAVKSGLVRFIWEPADPLLRQFANINQMLFSLNGYLMAHYEALADIQAYLEQQAEEPTPPPEATPTAARLYQANPPPEADTEEPEIAPPPQPGGQTFADLFKKK